jgi:hypothetical protein
MVSLSTFLNQPEWKTIPFSIDPKTDLDDLLDLLLDEVSLIQQGSVLANLPIHEQLPATIELLNKCWRFDDQMEQFYNHLKSRNPNPLYWPILLSDNDRKKDNSNILDLTSFEFCSVTVSVNLILYWASLTVLWSGMSRLYDVLAELAGSQFPSIANSLGNKDLYEKLKVPDRGHIQNFIATAHKVCFSTAFGLREEFGVQIVVAPLVMIRQALRPWNRYFEEVAWVESKLEQLEGKGLILLKYSKDITAK